jgi:hypothetical protein
MRYVLLLRVYPRLIGWSNNGVLAVPQQWFLLA